jgi:hypothetical protein
MNRNTLRDVLLCAAIAVAMALYFTLGATV